MPRRTSVEDAVSARKWSLFVAAMTALMIGSAGVAIFPDIAQLAAPVACSNGDLVTTTSSYTRGPGRSGTRTSAACVDATGAKSQVNAFFIMLVIMGELFIPFAGIGWWISSQVWPYPAPETEDD